MQGYNQFTINTSIYILCFTDKPTAPNNLHVTEQNKTYISLAWEKPDSDGGAPITGYVIERREASRTTWAGELQVA